MAAKRRAPGCCTLLGLAVAIAAAAIGLLGQRYTPLLLARESNRSCLPEGWEGRGPEPLAAPLEPALRREFDRDGAVIIRGALSEEWTARLRETVLDSFEHPTTWDKMYTTGLASFFCAQKTVLLPSTSRCGQHMARFSPLASYAAALLGSETLRVAEPSEGMASFRATKGNCGHTAYHRDDSYFPIRAAQPAAGGTGEPPIAVVRFWIPLEEMTPENHRMEFVNGSHRTRETDNLSSTQFATHAAQDHSKLRLISWHAKPGDVIAFAGETVHNAATRSCTSCLRLILGFAGDSAVFDSTVPSPLMPLGLDQEHGAPLHGRAFPLVYDSRSGVHHHPEEWLPLAPSVMDVASAAKDTVVQGLKGFEGTWFTGCTVRYPFGPYQLGPWTVGPFHTPEICGPKAATPEADFWATVVRVFERAPLLAVRASTKATV